MQIKEVEITALIPYAKNSRTHDDAQVAQIAASIKEFGWTNPILVDGDKGIIAGHGRLMAARKLKMDKVPVIELKGMTEAQKKAYVIADNRLALNAGWDNAMLTIELQDLEDDGFDLSLMGFDKDELDALLNPIVETDGLTDEDAVPDVPDEPKTKLGDIYILGNHRLMCGDSTSIDAVDKLMDGHAVDMVYTDPPYGISIVGKNGKVGGDNLAKNGVYAPVAGDDSIDVAVEVIQVIHTLSAKVEIIWGGNYYANSLENKSSWIVWDKSGDMASNNFADCELAWCSSGTAARIYKQIWSGMIKEGESGKRVHPTQKPVALAEWCYDQYGSECKTVLDLFAGSGSSLIACEAKNKQGFMMELAPAYCDVIVKRWEDFTGKQAVLSEL
jgi:DNA modification methylase